MADNSKMVQAAETTQQTAGQTTSEKAAETEETKTTKVAPIAATGLSVQVGESVSASQVIANSSELSGASISWETEPDTTPDNPETPTLLNLMISQPLQTTSLMTRLMLTRLILTSHLQPKQMILIT